MDQAALRPESKPSQNACWTSGPVVAEVLRLAGEVVDGDVELGLVEVVLELVVGREASDEAVGGAVERVRPGR